MAVAFSADYFKLSGKIRMVFDSSGSEVNPVAFNSVRQEAFMAKAEGHISEQEYISLMNTIDKGVSVERSEEYVRILQVHNDYTKAGTASLSSEAKTELEDEISLAFRHGLLPEKDRDDLLRILDGGTVAVVEGVDSGSSAKIIGINYRSTKDVPSRRRRRETSGRGSGHTPEYERLFDEYRKLYSADAVDNRRSSVTAFFREVDTAYRGGLITLSEYRDFHAALDDQEAYMADIDISHRDPSFGEFKEQLLDLMGDDMMVEQVIKQILVWKQKSGVSERLIKSNPVSVALQALESFFGANQSIVTMHTKTAEGYNGLLKMKLS